MLCFKVKDKKTLDKMIVRKNIQTAILKEILLNTSHDLNLFFYNNIILLDNKTYNTLIMQMHELYGTPLGTHFIKDDTLYLRESIIFLDKNNEVIDVKSLSISKELRDKCSGQAMFYN